MLPIDQVQLHFNPATLAILNVILGLVMFGIALDLKTSRISAPPSSRPKVCCWQRSATTSSSRR
jgi:hypothetical protein